MTLLRYIAAAAMGVALGLTAPGQTNLPTPGELEVYFVDVEGGQATLFVTPSGESLLVDTGSAGPGSGARDASRIAELCKTAGVARIDSLLITHYHSDHVGGLPALVAMVPVGRFIDHGPNRETLDLPDAKPTVDGYNAYQKVLGGAHAEHLTVKPGDTIPVAGMHVEIVSADGEVIASPLPGAGKANAACAQSTIKDAENSENDRSVGMVLTFAGVRILDLGDLTWARERPLMCPVDTIGRVDVYIVSHHGLDRSGSPALVQAMAPRIAIMDNGARKGGAASTFETIQSSPRLIDLWQLHTAVGNDAAHNVAEAKIANLTGPDTGNYLKLTVHADGSMEILNSRTGDAHRYAAR